MIQIGTEQLQWIEFRAALVHALLSQKSVSVSGIDSLPDRVFPLLDEIKNICEKYFSCEWDRQQNTLIFTPGKVAAGKYYLRSGPFSSAVEILLFLMPLLSEKDFPSEVTIEGVTHSSFGGSTAYLQDGLLPLLEQRGVLCSCRLQRFGFYGTGKGRCVSRIYPSENNISARLSNEDLEVYGAKIFVSKLSTALAERQRSIISSGLRLDEKKITIMEIINAAGMGNSIAIYTSSGVFTCDVDAYNEAGDLIYDEEYAGKQIENVVRNITAFSGRYEQAVVDEIEIFKNINISQQSIIAEVKKLFT